LRAHEMTDAHLELYAQLRLDAGDNTGILEKKIEENEDFKSSVKALREKMKVMTGENIRQDSRLVDAIKTYFGASYLDDIWVLIQDFFNHDFVMMKLPDEQIWYVD
jgi:hypothetical protein